MNGRHWMIQRVTRRDPWPTITAPPPVLRVYNMRADDNREAYIAQSRATRGGVVAPIVLRRETT